MSANSMYNISYCVATIALIDSNMNMSSKWTPGSEISKAHFSAPARPFQVLFHSPVAYHVSPKPRKCLSLPLIESLLDTLTSCHLSPSSPFPEPRWQHWRVCPQKFFEWWVFHMRQYMLSSADQVFRSALSCVANGTGSLCQSGVCQRVLVSLNGRNRGGKHSQLCVSSTNHCQSLHRSITSRPFSFTQVSYAQYQRLPMNTWA